MQINISLSAGKQRQKGIISKIRQLVEEECSSIGNDKRVKEAIEHLVLDASNSDSLRDAGISLRKISGEKTFVSNGVAILNIFEVGHKSGSLPVTVEQLFDAANRSGTFFNVSNSSPIGNMSTSDTVNDAFEPLPIDNDYVEPVTLGDKAILQAGVPIAPIPVSEFMAVPRGMPANSTGTLIFKTSDLGDTIIVAYSMDFGALVSTVK